MKIIRKIYAFLLLKNLKMQDCFNVEADAVNAAVKAVEDALPVKVENVGSKN